MRAFRVGCRGRAGRLGRDESTEAKEQLVASRLNPYLSFAGTARPALEFYRDVFGGSLAMHTFGEAGAAHSADQSDQIMHGMLETDTGYTIMASDTPPGMDLHPGDAITVSLSGDDADQLRGYWARLSEGGKVSVPLEKQMWGDEFGMCVDRFGVPWMVNIAGG
jgi:PhnB protein